LGKGIVEKNVQDSRRRIWLDAQDCLFHTFDELNVWLGQRCRTLWSELPHPQYKGLTVADVLELERVEMMPMPSAFDGYVERTVRVLQYLPDQRGTQSLFGALRARRSVGQQPFISLADCCRC
jgi:hypothetical protein